MWGELVRAREGAVALGLVGDKALLDSLETFYRNSDVVRLAGSDLVPGIVHSAA